MPFHWNAPQDKSFNDLNSALINAPALAFPEYSVPFSLYTDASALGLGDVLMQLDTCVATPKQCYIDYFFFFFFFLGHTVVGDGIHTMDDKI